MRFLKSSIIIAMISIVLTCVFHIEGLFSFRDYILISLVALLFLCYLFTVFAKSYLRVGKGNITIRHLEQESRKYNSYKFNQHDDISVLTYRRLRLRHAQAEKVYQETYDLLKDCFNFKSSNEEYPRIAYALGVTDLFVEKALSYLEDHARPYRIWGHLNFVGAAFFIFVGASIACFLMLSPILERFSDHLPNELAHVQMLKDLSVHDALWSYTLMSFARAFTAYGMIVLIAVSFWRQGKALLDQAERVSEKCHALRQGRLFVHLKFGKPMSIEEFESAFNWNLSQENAFTTVPTEASAPWGTAFKALADSLALTLKGKKDEAK